MAIYKRFLDGIPDYLARHYWWAYLWAPTIRFFDHQPIINAILFGQYDNLLNGTLDLIDTRPGIRTLQLTCVYGKLTPKLMQATGQELFLCDVATAQLELARRKTAGRPLSCHLSRMNAEQLGYRDETFDQIVIFFLFHEIPPDARRRTLAEVARVIRPGGTILVTEYAETPSRHWLYRFTPFRLLLSRLEPFLPDFWNETLASSVADTLRASGKMPGEQANETHYFGGFYRVMRFPVTARDENAD